MRRVLILFLVLLVACQKAVYIEKTKQLDTITFNKRNLSYDFSYYKFSDNHFLQNTNEHFFKGQVDSFLRNDHIRLNVLEDYVLSFEILNVSDLTLRLVDNQKEVLNQELKEAGFYEFSFYNEDELLSLEFIFKSDNTIIKNISFKAKNDDVSQIRINQLGYLKDATKIFNTASYVGDYYSVYNKDNHKVYQGNFHYFGFSQHTGEELFEADFSFLNKEGTYYIVSELGYRSYDFNLQTKLYDDLKNASLKMIKAQRCGFQLDENEFFELAHPMCHQQDAVLYESLFYDYRIHLDVKGGWHDAGDYGRYSQTINKVLNDLILSYFLGDQDESLINEIKWGVDFLLKMQDESGGIYLKAVSERFAPMIYPDDDHSPIFVLNRSTNVSANAVMIFNLASIIFQDDVNYSELLKKAALKAYDYMSNHQYNEIKNPKHFNAGYYKEDYDFDERYNAYASMYLIYQDDSYLTKIEDIINHHFDALTSGFNYDNSDAYGSFILLFLNHNHYLFKTIKDLFLSDVLEIYENAKQNPYLISNLNLVWGSNYRYLDDAKKFYLAYLLVGNEDLKTLSLNSIDYVLGKNPLNQSYITGYGYNYPLNIHHRITISNPKAQIKGALVGGPNAYLEDAVVKNLFDYDVPELKRYVDDSFSYSTNEVAIYYNSALYSLLSIIK